MTLKFFHYIYRNRRFILHCLEGFLDLAIAKCLIVFSPFPFLSDTYGAAQSETVWENMSCHKNEISTIRHSIQWVATFVPWKSKCLDQAMAAQRMLSRRKLQTTLYFGMGKDEQKQFIAHAWLRSGNQWVIGYHPQQSYTIVGSYAHIP